MTATDRHFSMAIHRHSSVAIDTWRPSNPWHQLYSDLAQRAGKNPAKAAVARKILIAAWHVLSRQQPFKAAAPRRPDSASASSRCFLAA